MQISKAEYKRKWRKTPYGFISHLYDNQKMLSRKRQHPLPEWTAQQLYVYAMNSPKFLTLFSEWVKSGYSRKLVPSFDRVDPERFYTWDNIQIVTGHFNCHVKGAGEVNRYRKMSVNQLCPVSGKVIKKFVDATEAVRFLGKKSYSNIHACIYGRTKRAYGFGWEYAK